MARAIARSHHEPQGTSDYRVRHTGQIAFLRWWERGTGSVTRRSRSNSSSQAAFVAALGLVIDDSTCGGRVEDRTVMSVNPFDCYGAYGLANAISFSKITRSDHSRRCLPWRRHGLRNCTIRRGIDQLRFIMCRPRSPTDRDPGFVPSTSLGTR